MLVKREVYNQVKGFDEDYFMYGEDIDLSYKIKKAGYQSFYYGETVIIHYKGESTLKDKTYAKRFYGAMQIFYKKHFKSNVVFDALVFLGIQSAKIFSRKSKRKHSLPDGYLLVSNKNYPELEKKLRKPVLRYNNDSKRNLENKQLIFDASWKSYKNIIEDMAKLKTEKNISFKILPKNTNYILGSHTSTSRGEVIHF